MGQVRRFTGDKRSMKIEIKKYINGTYDSKEIINGLSYINNNYPLITENDFSEMSNNDFNDREIAFKILLKNQPYYNKINWPESKNNWPIEAMQYIKFSVVDLGGTEGIQLKAEIIDGSQSSNFTSPFSRNFPEDFKIRYRIAEYSETEPHVLIETEQEIEINIPKGQLSGTTTGQTHGGLFTLDSKKYLLGLWRYPTITNFGTNLGLNGGLSNTQGTFVVYGKYPFYNPSQPDNNLRDLILRTDNDGYYVGTKPILNGRQLFYGAYTTYTEITNNDKITYNTTNPEGLTLFYV